MQPLNLGRLVGFILIMGVVCAAGVVAIHAAADTEASTKSAHFPSLAILCVMANTKFFASSLSSVNDPSLDLPDQGFLWLEYTSSKLVGF